MERKPDSPPVAQTRPVLGIIDALSAGLDAALRHPWLLLIPLLLDLFLWVGPRMQAPALYRSFEPAVRQMATAMTSAEVRLAAQELGQAIERFFTQYNLFTWLSAGLIGVPVINGGIDATLPLVTGSLPTLWQVDSLDRYLLVFVLLTVAGLFVSALFWTMLGDFVRGEPWRAAGWLRRSLGVWKKLLLLTLVVAGLALMSLFPLSMIMITISSFSAGLASIVPLLVAALAMWIVLVCLFTPHGLALYHMPLSRAISTSSLIVRANFAATVGLAAIALAISIGTGLIWEWVAADSWLRLVAMGGSALIGTGLIVASLLFYQNRVTILFESHRWPLPAGS